ncbi:MAG: hypothetical protein IJC73_00400, partial [Lentisphaeria bacterium]|nr:hypothetical protein [Lentisphaeria bacterium]
MSDYYVMYAGVQYDVDSFDAGIAKAKELGADAVFYVNAAYQGSTHAFCDGVKTVFAGGCAPKYVFGGNDTSAIASSDITFTNGVYGSVYGGGMTDGTVANSHLTVAGGTITNVYAGGRPASGMAEVLVTGGTSSFVFGTGNNGTLDETVVTITGGRVNYVKAATNQATVQKFTLNMEGGWIYNQIIGGGKGVVGDVTLNISGGTVRQQIYGSGDVIGSETRTGSTTINMNGIDFSGYVYGMWKIAPTAITINMTQGRAGLLVGGGNGTQAEAIVAECPVKITMTGGTVGYILGGSYGYATIKGNVEINFAGGLVTTALYGGGYKKTLGVIGDTNVNISGGTILCQVCGGGKDEIQGNTNVTITGGLFEGNSCWIVGGGNDNVVTGKATIRVENAEVYHIFGGGNTVNAVVNGGTEVLLKNALVHGVAQGGGYKGNVEGGVSITMTGGTTFRDKKASYGTAGWVIGGSTHVGTVKGDIVTTVTGATVGGSIVGGPYYSIAESNVTLTVSDTAVGSYNEDGSVDCGDIYTVAGSTVEVVGTKHTAVISGVSALGGLYQGDGGNYIEGDTTITVANSSFANIALEKGYWVEEVNEETGEITIGETKETEINGNVLFDLTNVTVSGNVYGQSLKLNLAKFSEEGQGVTLAVSGKLTAGGSVAYFQNITIAAGATIEAGSVTASAITATASAEDGAYLLATGFAAQDSVITVVNGGGSTIGTVTLSEAVT